MNGEAKTARTKQNIRRLHASFMPVELAMNQSQLRWDMNSGITTLTIQRTSTLASAMGFIGTPALVAGRTIVHGEITRSQLERLIENEMHPKLPKVC